MGQLQGWPGFGMSIRVTLGTNDQKFLEFGLDKHLQHVSIPI
jgi:hypothetical protein